MPSFSKYIKSKPLNAEKLSNSILSLPIYPELSYREQNKVINTIRNFLKKIIKFYYKLIFFFFFFKKRN